MISRNSPRKLTIIVVALCPDFVRGLEHYRVRLTDCRIQNQRRVKETRFPDRGGGSCLLLYLKGITRKVELAIVNQITRCPRKPYLVIHVRPCCELRYIINDLSCVFNAQLSVFVRTDNKNICECYVHKAN